MTEFRQEGLWRNVRSRFTSNVVTSLVGAASLPLEIFIGDTAAAVALGLAFGLMGSNQELNDYATNWGWQLPTPRRQSAPTAQQTEAFAAQWGEKLPTPRRQGHSGYPPYVPNPSKVVLVLGDGAANQAAPLIQRVLSEETREDVAVIATPALNGAGPDHLLYQTDYGPREVARVYPDENVVCHAIIVLGGNSDVYRNRKFAGEALQKLVGLTGQHGNPRLRNAAIYVVTPPNLEQAVGVPVPYQRQIGAQARKYQKGLVTEVVEQAHDEAGICHRDEAGRFLVNGSTITVMNAAEILDNAPGGHRGALSVRGGKGFHYTATGLQALVAELANQVTPDLTARPAIVPDPFAEIPVDQRPEATHRTDDLPVRFSGVRGNRRVLRSSGGESVVVPFEQRRAAHGRQSGRRPRTS